MRNSEIFELKIIQNLSLKCEQNCNLQINFVAQDLDFDPCPPFVAQNANQCQMDGKACNIYHFNVSAKPNFVSNFRQVKGTIKLTFQVNDKVFHHDFLDYQVENRPTSQCHLLTYGHIVTFDQYRQQISTSGRHILLQNGDFQAAVVLKDCEFGQRYVV